MASKWEDAPIVSASTPTQASPDVPTSGWQSAPTVEQPKSFIGKIVDGAKSATDPFRQSLADELHGMAKSGSVEAGDNIASSALNTAGSAIAPDNYVRPEVHYNDPKSYADIPKSLAEMAPKVGLDLAAGAGGSAVGAGIGGTIGGILGAPFAGVGAIPGAAAGAALGGIAGGYLGTTASMGARDYGNKAQSAADARTGIANSEITAEDKNKALASVAADGILARLGFKGATGTAIKAGESFAGQAAKQVGVGAATDAATGLGQQVLDSTILKGQLPTGQEAGDAAFGGATQGAAMRGAGLISDGLTASKNSDVNPEHAARYADLMKGVNDLSTPGKSYEAINKVNDDLSAEASAAMPQVKSHIKTISDADPFDTTGETLARVQTDIAAGRHPSPSDMEALQSTIGQAPHGEQLLSTLNTQAAGNQLAKQGVMDNGTRTFTGGAASLPFAKNWLNPLGHYGKYVDGSALLYGLTGASLPGVGHMVHSALDPASAFAIPAGQAATFGALKLMDRLSGRRNPAESFANRFGTSDGSAAGQPTPSGPAFSEVLAQAKAEQQAQALSDRQAAQEAGRAAKAPSPVDVALATAKRTSALMSASDRVDQQRQATDLGNIRQTSRQMTASEPDAPSFADQENPSVPGATNGEVAGIRTGIKAIMAREAMKAKADREAQSNVDEQLGNAKQTSKLMTASEGASATDAGPALRVANLKAGIAAAASKAAAGEAAAHGKAAAAHVSHQLAAARLSSRLRSTHEKSEARAKTAEAKANAPKAEPKAKASAAPKSSPVSSTQTAGDNTIISHRGMSVSYPTSAIHSMVPFVHSVTNRLDIRHNAINAAKAIGGPDSHAELNALHEKLNRNSLTERDAQHHIEATVNHPSMSAHAGKLLDALWTPKTRSTWANESAPK